GRAGPCGLVATGASGPRPSTQLLRAGACRGAVLPRSDGPRHGTVLREVPWRGTFQEEAWRRPGRGRFCDGPRAETTGDVFTSGAGSRDRRGVMTRTRDGRSSKSVVTGDVIPETERIEEPAALEALPKAWTESMRDRKGERDDVWNRGHH